MAIILRWTRGHCRILKRDAARLRAGWRVSSARKGPEGMVACKMRSSTPRCASVSSVSRMETYFPRARATLPMGASSIMLLTFAVPIQIDTSAFVIAPRTSSS